MATVLQSNTADEALVESDFQVLGVLREANGEAGDRKVVLDLICEGFGNAADGHYYSRKLLERIAPLFEGAKMYSDHLTQEAEKKLGGMPRSWRDMVGQITRVWTDVNEAGKRVIRGEARIFDDHLWRLLEQAIDVVGVSINARGLASPGTVDGRPARIVDDITKVKSVDVVAEAGAGGRILALVEAAVETAIQEGAQMTTRNQASIDAELERDLLEDDAEGADAEPDTTAAADSSDDQPAPDPQAASTGEDEEYADDDEEYADDEEDDEESSSATQAIAREAARAVLREMGMRPGDPVRGLSHPVGVDASWDDGSGYVDYDPDALHQPGDPIDTRRSRQGRATHLTLSDALHEADDDPIDLTGEDDGDDDDIPGLPDDTEAAVEAMIEARARELAGQRLYEAVREAMVVVREHYEDANATALAEAQAKFERDLQQRDQRHLAAGLIESAHLPRPSEAELKGEFFDAFYEGGESALREAVRDRVEAKQRELGIFTGARVTNAGGTVAIAEAQHGGDRRALVNRAPGRAEIDEGIDRELDDQRSEA